MENSAPKQRFIRIDEVSRLGAALLFAIETGMRLGEIHKLTWENVNLERRTAFLPETKNGYARTVPLNENEASFIEYPFDETQRTPNKTAGFRILPNETTKELEHFLLYPKAFKEILSNYPIKMACETLANAGILVKPAKPEQGYEYMFIVSQKLVGKRKVRAYKIKPLLQDENEN